MQCSVDVRPCTCPCRLHEVLLFGLFHMLTLTDTVMPGCTLCVAASFNTQTPGRDPARQLWRQDGSFRGIKRELWYVEDFAVVSLWASLLAHQRPNSCYEVISQWCKKGFLHTLLFSWWGEVTQYGKRLQTVETGGVENKLVRQVCEVLYCPLRAQCIHSYPWLGPNERNLLLWHHRQNMLCIFMWTETFLGWDFYLFGFGFVYVHWEEVEMCVHLHLCQWL